MENVAIEVKTQFEGLHCWPDAPAEVGFLRRLHRHMFHVVVRIPVTHNDRELEFIMVKRALDDFLRCNFNKTADGVTVMNRMSCEDIAKVIVDWVHTTYDRYDGVVVGVFEDGENGCWLEVANGV